MRIGYSSYFVMECVCGKLHRREMGQEQFRCDICGRPSLMNWFGIPDEKLIEKLNGFQMQADAIAREIENRRQKVA